MREEKVRKRTNKSARLRPFVIPVSAVRKPCTCLIVLSRVSATLGSWSNQNQHPYNIRVTLSWGPRGACRGRPRRTVRRQCGTRHSAAASQHNFNTYCCDPGTSDCKYPNINHVKSTVFLDTMLQAGRTRLRVPMRWIFFNWPNPSSRTMALGSTQPLTEMSTRNLPEHKGPSARKAATPPPSMSRLSIKCGSLDVSQPHGPSRHVGLYCRVVTTRYVSQQHIASIFRIEAKHETSTNRR
jgi:hypothetical protein